MSLFAGRMPGLLIFHRRAKYAEKKGILLKLRVLGGELTVLFYEILTWTRGGVMSFTEIFFCKSASSTTLGVSS